MLAMALAPNRQGDMRDSIPHPMQNCWATPDTWAEMEAMAREYWVRVGLLKNRQLALYVFIEYIN
jgi:hypothetical protein